MSNIGAIYAQGQGVTQDFAQAMIWFKKAADRGDSGGMYNLGQLYDTGNGVPQDHAQARIWYRKAAAGGDENAQKWLTDHVDSTAPADSK
jgi:TPR repeat protein